MAARKPGTAGGGTKSRDKGTRGGRPDASVAAGQRPATRPARPGNGQSRTARPAPGKPAAADRPAAAEAAPVPPWLQWSTLALSLAGLGVSIYLTIAHFNTSVSLACPATSTVNCEKVTTSPQSYAFGIPVAVLGLAFFVFMVAVNSPWGWRAPWPAVRWARLGSVLVGIVFVLYLVYSELFSIGAICLWCTSVHVITFLLFALIVFSMAAGYGAATAPDRG